MNESEIDYKEIVRNYLQNTSTPMPDTLIGGFEAKRSVDGKFLLYRFYAEYGINEGDCVLWTTFDEQAKGNLPMIPWGHVERYLASQRHEESKKQRMINELERSGFSTEGYPSFYRDFLGVRTKLSDVQEEEQSISDAHIYGLDKIPYEIMTYLKAGEGWLVGSGASYILGRKKEIPNDWDVLIPFWKWGEVSNLLGHGHVTNHSGGIKVKLNSATMDIWCGDIGWYFGQLPNQFDAVAINPLNKIVLESHRMKLK